MDRALLMSCAEGKEKEVWTPRPSCSFSGLLLKLLVSSTEDMKRRRGSGRGRWLPTDSLSVSQSLYIRFRAWTPCVVEREVLLVQRCGSLAGSAFSAPEITGSSPQGQKSHAQRTQPRLMPGIQASKSFCARTRLTCTVRPSLSLLIYKRGSP